MNQVSRLSLVVPVLPAIGRPGKAGQLARRAEHGHAHHHVQDLVDRRRIVERLTVVDDLGHGGLLPRLQEFWRCLTAVLAEPRLVAIDRLAVAVLHPVDQRRRDLARAVGQHGVRHGHAQQGRVDGAQRHRQVGAHLVGDAEVVCDLDHPRHADLLGHAHGHEVARLLDAVAHRYRAERLLVAVVARPPHWLAVAR